MHGISDSKPWSKLDIYLFTMGCQETLRWLITIWVTGKQIPYTQQLPLSLNALPGMEFRRL